MGRDYREVSGRVRAVCDGEDDGVALMATLACELRQGFPDFDWVGFYRVTAPGLLKIGPYQGGHGCLTIRFDQGVCGAAAREQEAGGLGRVAADRGRRLGAVGHARRVAEVEDRLRRQAAPQLADDGEPADALGDRPQRGRRRARHDER